MNVMAAVLRGPADRAIVESEARIRMAQLSGDAEALEALLADDLLFTGPDGRLGTKAEDLAAHRSGAVRFRSHEPEELRIRRVGDNVAITALRARLEVAIGERIGRGTYRYTRIWERESSGSWRVVGGHVSAIPDAKPDAGAP